MLEIYLYQKPAQSIKGLRGIRHGNIDPGAKSAMFLGCLSGGAITCPVVLVLSPALRGGARNCNRTCTSGKTWVSDL